MTNIRQNSSPVEQYRVNHRIRIPKIRVIGHDGVQLGVMDTPDALRLAKEQGLDLVEVSPKAIPPVCKIMDFGRFKYEIAKKEREERAKRTVIEVKEIKLRPVTNDHDFEFKVKHVREFLTEGNKTRLVIQFKGRESMHPETGHAILKRVVDACLDIGQVEQPAMMEGKKIILLLAPRTKTQPVKATSPSSLGPMIAPQVVLKT